MKYEKPALVALHYTNIGHGLCKIGSIEVSSCRDGGTAISQCNTGTAEVASQIPCKAGTSPPGKCQGGSGA